MSSYAEIKGWRAWRLNGLEFSNTSNYIYAVIPAACLAVMILAARKRDRIIRTLNINASVRFRITRIVLMIAGLIIMCIALMGPQVFAGYTDIQSEGLNIYVLIDTSKSMLVQDVEPDRITRAKRITKAVLDRLDGDRIGFIPFSSDAYIQMPLTSDYEMARMFLDVIDTNMTGTGGTDIGSAVRLAVGSFDRNFSGNRVIIILSDGEEHRTSSLDAVKEIKDDQLRIYTIGIGTTEGGFVPEYDSSNTLMIGYKMDSNFETVVSRLRPELLKKLAAAGKGAYWQATADGAETDNLVKEISKLKRDAFEIKRIRNYEQVYQYFLGAGLLFVLASYLLPERRTV